MSTMKHNAQWLSRFFRCCNAFSREVGIFHRTRKVTLIKLRIFRDLLCVTSTLVLRRYFMTPLLIRKLAVHFCDGYSSSICSTNLLVFFAIFRWFHGLFFGSSFSTL